MASFTSTRGRYGLLGTYFRAASAQTPSGFYVALITAAGIGTTVAPVAPNATNCLVWADCSANEVPNGNGYITGGIPIARNSTDFPSFVEDTVNNRAIIGLKTISWTASGGNLPASGTGAAYAILMDSSASRNVIAIFDLGGNRIVSNSQQLILQSLEYIIA